MKWREIILCELSSVISIFNPLGFYLIFPAAVKFQTLHGWFVQGDELETQRLIFKTSKHRSKHVYIQYNKWYSESSNLKSFT